jgi:4-amino-4-deoxy-L-arabinose transferase-like glycosyltransferase
MDKKTSERWFWVALAFCALVHLAHGLLLPILVTYDGSEYVRLADLIHAPRFMEEYCFRRTPIYPLALKIMFKFGGRNPLGAQIPNLLLGFGGIALVALALRRMGRPGLGALCAVAMTLDPVLVSYEHAMLTEASSFFFVALIVYALLWTKLNTALRSVLVGLCIALAFYQRATLLYLAPVAGVLVFADLLFREAQRNRAAWLRAIENGLAVILIPFVLAYPWNRLLANSDEKNFGKQILMYGVLKQGVVLLDDPVLGPSQPAYRAALETCAPGGNFDLAGLTQSAMQPVEHEMFARCGSEGSTIFWRAIGANPGGYLRGVGRTVLYFAGLPNQDSENQYYVRSVITEAAAGSKLQGTNHPLYPEAVRDFTQKTSASWISTFLDALYPLYRVLLPLGVLFTTIGFFAGAWQKELALAAFCALPLAILAMHAVALIAVDRYVVPAYPFFIANVLIVPALMFSRRDV